MRGFRVQGTPSAPPSTVRRNGSWVREMRIEMVSTLGNWAEGYPQARSQRRWFTAANWPFLFSIPGTIQA